MLRFHGRSALFIDSWVPRMSLRQGRLAYASLEQPVDAVSCWVPFRIDSLAHQKVDAAVAWRGVCPSKQRTTGSACEALGHIPGVMAMACRQIVRA